MRVSRIGLLRLGAVLAVMSALPCLGQSQLTVITIHTNHASKLSVPGVQQKAQAKLQEKSQKQLQEQLQKKLSAEVMLKMQELKRKNAPAGETQLAQRGCFTMRVFQYPKGFPEKNARALPKVSDCTPASRFHKSGLVEGVQVFRVKQKH